MDNHNNHSEYEWQYHQDTRDAVYEIGAVILLLLAILAIGFLVYFGLPAIVSVFAQMG